MVRPFIPLPDRPPDFPDGYKRWLKDEHGVEPDQLPNHYRAVTQEIHTALSKCDFWCALTTNLREFNDKYELAHNYPLFTQSDPSILVKPFDSFLLKTYRKNVLLNTFFPNKPRDGWVLPPDWFSSVNDIARTTLVVKYLDGVEFLISEMYAIASGLGVELKHSLEASPEGYYAAHVYYSTTISIPRINWDTERRKISFEIQITTQIKDVIKKLLHSYYKKRRTAPKSRTENWQWDYRSEEFAVSYLGHILHYVDGMIIEIRDREMES